MSKEFDKLARETQLGRVAHSTFIDAFADPEKRSKFVMILRLQDNKGKVFASTMLGQDQLTKFLESAHATHQAMLTEEANKEFPTASQIMH